MDVGEQRQCRRCAVGSQSSLAGWLSVQRACAVGRGRSVVVCPATSRDRLEARSQLKGPRPQGERACSTGPSAWRLISLSRGSGGLEAPPGRRRARAQGTQGGERRGQRRQGSAGGQQTAGRGCCCVGSRGGSRIGASPPPGRFDGRGQRGYAGCGRGRASGRREDGCQMPRAAGWSGRPVAP